MSYWTHICGCIRIDKLRLNEEESKKEYDKIKNCLNINIPTGSEGPIEYSIITNPDLSYVSAYTVVICGDLRDYEKNIHPIEDWFNNICSKFDIRQAVLTINSDYSIGSKTITYNF